MKIRCYTELERYESFEGRYRYLKLGGEVGMSTFGHSRFINQSFYTSRVWRSVRDIVILRDNGFDLGVVGHDIFDRLIIHHMNPITEEDIIHGSDFLLDPEFLICVSRDTHNAIHFGDENLLPKPYIERTRNDTIPWA